MTYDVFICYESTTGTDFAEHLKTAMEKAEHTVFLADITIRSGGEWEEEINSALTECKYFVVLITALTMGSKEVMKECNKATKLKKRIIPCRYSKIGVSETKELARLQQLEFENNSELANNVILEIRGISNNETKGIKIENDPEEFLSRGNLFFNLGNFSEALKAYDKAIELEPNFVVAWINKGIVLGKFGNHEEAIKYLDKAIELDPYDDLAWYNKGVAFGKLGRHDEVLKFMDEVIKLKSNDAGAWMNKGVSLDRLGRYNEALIAYDEAIGIRPDYAKAWISKGVVLERLGRYDEVLKAYDKAIEEIKPYLAVIWYNGACVYSLKGNKENALKDLSKAIDLDAKFKEYAKKNQGFEKLWNDEDFKKIVS